MLIVKIKYYDTKEQVTLDMVVEAEAVAYAEKDNSISVTSKNIIVGDYGPENKASVEVFTSNGYWLASYFTSPF